MDYIIDTVKHDDSVGARFENITLKTLYSRNAEMSFESYIVFAKHSAAADALSDYRAVADPEVIESVRQTVGPRLSRYGVAEGYDSFAVVCRIGEY